MGNGAAGAQSQARSLLGLPQESRLQRMDRGEPLKTVKQENAMVHLTLFVNGSGLQDKRGAFQDRWLETATGHGLIKAVPTAAVMAQMAGASAECLLWTRHRARNVHTCGLRGVSRGR